jgi:hypothetical protein
LQRETIGAVQRFLEFGDLIKPPGSRRVIDVILWLRNS